MAIIQYFMGVEINNFSSETLKAIHTEMAITQINNC